MQKYVFILLIGFLLASSSCDNDSENDDEFVCFKRDFNDNATYNIKGKWEFLGFLQQDTRYERCKPETVAEMNIEFSSRNRFHAVSSCNTFEGYYLINDKKNSIAIDSVGSTLIFCPNDTIRQWEANYLDELKRASNFHISRNILFIETQNRNSMVFKADND